MSKKRIAFLLCAVLLAVSTTQPINAHPGRTDGNGCHTCRTNCEKWGLSYGEYHCHNGGGSTSSSQPQTPPASNYTAPATTDTAPVNEYKAPVIDYKAEGKTDGYNAKMSSPDADLSAASYTYNDSAYREAYDEAFRKAESELRSSSIEKATAAGKADATTSEQYKLDTLPDNIIKSVYEENYKATFDARVKEIKDSLDAAAKTNAFNNIFDEKDPSEPDFYSLETYKTAYSEAYVSYQKQYKDEQKELRALSKENGKRDGKEGNDSDLSFLKKVKGTSFYDEAVKLYETAYDNNKEEVSPIPALIFLAVIALLIVLLVKKIRNRKANRLRIN